MPKLDFFIIDDFKLGWHKRTDESKIPVGAAEEMINVVISERGGIKPRPGEILIGQEQSGTGVLSMKSFQKTQAPHVLVKQYEDRLEYLNENTNTWSLIKDGYTLDAKFDYEHHDTDSELLDYLYFCNGVDPYSRWNGWTAETTAVLAGGETAIPVTSTLLPDTYHTDAASASTATTIDIATAKWGTDLWNDFYVHITSGANTGDIALITATTATQITFNTITGLSGTPTFEIRRLAISPTGTVVYNDQEVAYSAVPRIDEITVGSAVAAPTDSPITVSPEEFPVNPRGSALAVNLAQMFVGNVPSSPSTVYRSQLTDATDFTFSDPRSADEGDIVFINNGGSKIFDIADFENRLIILKKNYVGEITYTQDEFDIAQIDAIETGSNVGTVGRAWNMDNDLGWVTADKTITTLSRLENKDFRPQTRDLAFNIRRAMKMYGIDKVVGEQHVDKVYVGIKSSENTPSNDIMLVRSKDHFSWEGYWRSPAADIEVHNDELYYGHAAVPEVYKIDESTFDRVKGSDEFPLSNRWRSGFINLRGVPFYLDEVSSLAVEGYIRANTKIDFKMFKDFEPDSFVDLSLEGTEEENLDGDIQFNLLGTSSIGINPIGTYILGDEDSDGRRHFVVIFNFPFTPLEYFSLQFGSSGLSQDWEVISAGVNVTELAFEPFNRMKN